jgi:hypothetical protein
VSVSNFDYFSGSLADLVTCLEDRVESSGEMPDSFLRVIREVSSPTFRDLRSLKERVEKVAEDKAASPSIKKVASEVLLDIQFREDFLESGGGLDEALASLKIKAEDREVVKDQSKWKKSSDKYSISFKGVEITHDPKTGKTTLLAGGTWMDIGSKIRRDVLAEAPPPEVMQKALDYPVKSDDKRPFQGAFVIYNDFSRKITIYGSDTRTDVDTGIVTTKPDNTMGPDELKKIHTYVVENKKSMSLRAKESGEPLYVSMRDSRLARPLYFMPDGKVLAVCKEGAVDLETGELTSFKGEPLAAPAPVQVKKKSDEILKGIKLLHLNAWLNTHEVSPGDKLNLKSVLRKQEAWEKFSDAWITKSHGMEFVYDLSSKRITLIKDDEWVDLDSGISTRNPDAEKISPPEMKALHDFVVTNKQAYTQQAKSQGESIYLSPRRTGLVRSLHFSPEGRVVIHLNKKAHRFDSIHRNSWLSGDVLVERTRDRTVTMAVDLETGVRFASASMRPEDAKREIAFLQEFEEKKGFPQIQEVIQYRSGKRGKIKVRLLYTFVERGSLSDRIKKNDLTVLEKKQVTKRLIARLLVLNARGIVHRDIKPANILITGEGKDIEPILAGFSCIARNSLRGQKRSIEGSLAYMSPEYAKILPLKIKEERSSREKAVKEAEAKGDLCVFPSDFPGKCSSSTLDKIEAATTPAIDIWELGVLLDELYHDGERKFAPNIQGEHFGLHICQKIANFQEMPEPADPTSRDHLIWSMLRVDPANRITIREIIRRDSSWGGNG